MPLLPRLVRSAGISFLIIVLGTAASFVARIVIARILGDVQTFGDFIYAFSWLNTLLVIAPFGFDTTALRYVAAYFDHSQWGLLREFINHSQRTTLAFSALLGMLVATGAWLARETITPDLLVTLWIVSALIPVNSLAIVTSRYILALKKVIAAQAPLSLFRFMFLIGAVYVGIVVLRLPAHAYLVAMAYGVLTLVILLVSYLYLWPILKLGPLQNTGANSLRQEWNKNSFEVLIMNTFTLLVGRIDIIFVGFFVGTAQAGIYAAAATLSSLLSFALIAVNSIIAPLISEYHMEGRIDKFQQIATYAVLSVSCYCLVAGAGLIILGKPILGLFGEDFIEGYPALIVLLVGQIANSFAGSVGYLMTMTGHQRKALYPMAGGAVASLVLNLVLIPCFGTIGAAVATSVATALWNIAMYFQVRRYLGIDASVYSGLALLKRISYG